jgi:hypothetical protein
LAVVAAVDLILEVNIVLVVEEAQEAYSIDQYQ